jgi:hypothetical protein
VLEQLAAQVAHDALPKRRREDRLTVRAAERQQQGGRVQQRGSHGHACVVRRKRHVDHALREQRPDELQQPFGHEQDQRTGHEQAIRSHVRHKAPCEMTIVLPCRGVLVGRVGRETGSHDVR